MGNHALSDKVKKINQRRAKNHVMQQAVEDYLQEQQKPEDQRKGARIIAREHGIPGSYSTILNHAGGRNIPMSAFNASKQKLSPVEERVLVDFILGSAGRGFPMTMKQIDESANGILRRRLGEQYDEENKEHCVGKTWGTGFLNRHRSELQTTWSKHLDSQRAKALNPGAVKHWFELVETFIVKTGIRKEDVYGMDESGFPPSDQGTQRVVTARGQKTQHKSGSASRENVTALVTICADGTALKPTIIFKGKRFMAAWGQNNVAEAS